MLQAPSLLSLGVCAVAAGVAAHVARRALLHRRRSGTPALGFDAALARLSGSSVEDLILIVDFDRTLCSTRGGSPLNGHHSIDEELLSVISQFVGEKGNAAVQVVTRNAHVDDIKTFLARSGLGDVGVTRIARPRSKAEVVAAKGGVECEVALFVDDTISEHLDEEMRAAVGVVRFLFVRSL